MTESWEGDTTAAWAARWGVPRLEVHERIGSTNDRARELAEAGADPFTTVIAEEQSAGPGKGRETMGVSAEEWPVDECRGAGPGRVRSVALSRCE